MGNVELRTFIKGCGHERIELMINLASDFDQILRRKGKSKFKIRQGTAVLICTVYTGNE